jgi:allophanate hydrolase subunit 2
VGRHPRTCRHASTGLPRAIRGNVIEVRSWGIGGTVVGPGVAGRAWLGAARGGAVDLASFALANRLVGNPETALGFETSGGLGFSVSAPTMIAVTGAVAQIEVHHGPAVGWGNPVVLPDGASVRVVRLLDGARAYIAVRGGLTRGAEQLQVGVDPLSPAAEHAAPRRPPLTSVRVWPGPRRHWFHDDAWVHLLTMPYTVTATSRVGTRLSGAPLERVRPEELPSEGLVEGAVQVPPDGQPIVMLADHPTTGGYPVLAVVDPSDIADVAQAAVGTVLRFVRV